MLDLVENAARPPLLDPITTDVPGVGLIHAREIGPQDRSALLAGFDAMSDRSRHMRFLGAHPRLTETELDTLTAPGDADHAAIGLSVETDQGDMPAAVARYVREPGHAARAEFAIAIADAFQGKGLGSLMLGLLSAHAAQAGISELTGYVHAENAAMLHLARAAGAHTLSDGADAQVVLPISTDAHIYPDTSVGTAFRRAYALAEFSRA